MSQSISLGYGKANFDTNSVTIATFAVSSGFARTFPNRVFGVKGRVQPFPASHYPEINGTLMLATFDVPDGNIIAVQASHRVRGMSMRDGTVFIRAREQGAMYAITAVLPTHRDSLVGTGHLVFQGRGDLVGLYELDEMGMSPNQGYVDGFLDPHELAECFDIRQLDDPISSAPKVEHAINMSGEAVTFTSSVPRRRIRVR